MAIHQEQGRWIVDQATRTQHQQLVAKLRAGTATSTEVQTVLAELLALSMANERANGS